MSGSLKIRTEYEDICILYQCPPNSNTSREVSIIRRKRLLTIDASQPLLTLLQQLKGQVAIVVMQKVTYDLSNMGFHSLNCWLLNLRTTD